MRRFKKFMDKKKSRYWRKHFRKGEHNKEKKKIKKEIRSNNRYAMNTKS